MMAGSLSVADIDSYRQLETHPRLGREKRVRIQAPPEALG